MTTIVKILVPVDFSPASDAALEYALAMADACGAEVEILHVWRPHEGFFADTPQGRAMQLCLTAAESDHPARLSGRLELGCDPSHVILDILARESFDLVVMGTDGRDEADGGERVPARVARAARCKVMTRALSDGSRDEDEAA